MKILNEVFDKIYCVTVHHFFDRHELVKLQLRGVDFQWVFSPPAKLLSPSPHVTLTEQSLIIGHMACLWDAKLKEYDKILIWEDDNKLVVTENEMRKFFDALPEVWDCLYLANAKWNDGIHPVRTTPVSPLINKVFWATGSGLNAVRRHSYDQLLSKMAEFKTPVDYSYYDIFAAGKSYSPAKKYFSDPISMPNEHYLDQVKNLAGYIPSRINHRN